MEKINDAYFLHFQLEQWAKKIDMYSLAHLHSSGRFYMKFFTCLKYTQ